MIKDESGRLVLESALVFPLIMMFTIASLFVALSAGIHSSILVGTDLAASRAAFAWDNSHRNPVTGDFFPGQYDGLYWRITDDHSHSALTEKKLDAALSAARLTRVKDGEYRNRIWIRQVSIGMTAPLRVPLWVDKWKGGGTHVASESVSIVADPAEWVRTVGMVKQYWPLIKDSITSKQAEQIVDEFRNRSDAESGELVFDSHNEARAYLQMTVNGRLSKETTEEVGEWRLIDALDRYGIAHQAYFGLKKNDRDMRDQLLKDAELLRRGKVNGVTWHFFRRDRDRSIGLTDSLRGELEKRGIVVVVHE